MNEDFTFYENTQIPTYTSVTGVKIKDVLNKDDIIMYIYDFNSEDVFISYMKNLWNQGWTEEQLEDNIYDESVVMFRLTKGDEFVYLGVDFKTNEVYVMYTYKKRDFF